MALLLEAFERSEKEQRAFLEEACGEDATLLADALAHLSDEKRLDDFLEAPADAKLAKHPFGIGVERPDPPTGTTGSLPATDPGHFGRHHRTRTVDPSPAEDDDPDLLSRRRLGAYEIVGTVGAGGMGQIYAGEDTRLDRRVAVKVLPQSKADRSGWLARFEREARVLASLNHPNIVTIHSVEEDDGIRFLTMELIDGKTLGESIPEDGLPLEDFLLFATELTRALTAAHERGVIHRDLKPANVMITPDRRVKVLDFGLAKEPSRRDHALSQEGVLLGTVPYMAPEQLKGQPADARSDLFALGVVLYQMALGEHPFPAKGVVRSAKAILNNEPRSLDAVRRKLGSEIGDVVTRCLEKEPDRRFQSAGEIRNRLERLLDTRLAEKILESRTDLRRGAAWRGASRRRWPMLAAAVAVLAALALAAAVLRHRPPAATSAEAADAARGVAPEERERNVPPRTSLAVFVFNNLSGDPELEWLATGIPELLITDLSQAPGLRVLDTGELHRVHKQLADRGQTAPSSEEIWEMARATRVEAVLRGSYARLGGVLRIVYFLDDPASGETRLSASIEGRGEDSLFALVDQLSAAVLGSLDATRPDLGPATVGEATTASVAAWQAYSQGLLLYHEESRPQEAIESLEEALRIDPEFALAAANLAKMHQSLGRTAKAQEYAKHAFELPDRLPLNARFGAEAGHFGARWATTGRAIETYLVALKVYPDVETWRNNLARRYAFFERYPEAIEEFQILIDGGVGYWGDYYGAANSYAALGDFETGYRLLADFAEKKPDNWLLHYSLAWHLTEWGKLEEARSAFDHVATLRPKAIQLHYGRWRLAVLSEAWDQAELEARRLLAFEDAFGRWRGNVALAQGALYAGRSAAALGWLNAAIQASAGADRALARCFKAELLLARGDRGQALGEARQAQEEGREQWPELRGLYLAALAEQALGRPAAADALLETLRERWRRQPNVVEERQLHHLSGLLALRRGDLEAALTALERAAALLPAAGIEFSWHVFPAHVPIWTDLGEAELAAGRPRAARGWLARATASGSEHLEQPVAYVKSIYLEALAYRRLGEQAEAEQRFERFLGFWADGDLGDEWQAEARSHRLAGEISSD